MRKAFLSVLLTTVPIWGAAYAQYTIYQMPQRPTPNDVSRQYLDRAQQQSQYGVQPPMMYRAPQPQTCQSNGHGGFVCR